MIEEPAVIEKILTHTSGWPRKRRRAQRQCGGWIYWSGCEEAGGSYRAGEQLAPCELRAENVFLKQLVGGDSRVAAFTAFASCGRVMAKFDQLTTMAVARYSGLYAKMAFEIPSAAFGRNQITAETSLHLAKKSRQKNLFPVE